MLRELLYLFLIILIVPGCSIFYKAYQKDGTEVYFKETLKPFYHGVASGDPLSDRVIIWTRVTPTFQRPVEVQWMISEQANMAQPIQQGLITTDSTRDYTVKIDITGLTPNTTYYYQFKALKGQSIIGRTKTTAATSRGVQLAIVSCSNYEAGYYNAFARIAERDEIDAVLHLGDYIYEYGPGTYGNANLAPSRQHLPRKEILSLADYRTRYAQYRLDPDFQKAHQMHPFITIWDDHEFSNNVYQSGAENHQTEEGDFERRKAIAKQVYFEWLPIRAAKTPSIYRTISFGDLVDVILLDERIVGRTMPVDSVQQEDFQANTRSMLGKEQLDWFKKQLTTSKAKWKIIGNQVIFSPLDLSWRNPKIPYNLDAWDGYPYEQQQIRQFLWDNKISNVLFTTGDTHCSWAFEVPTSLAAYKENTNQTVAIELGTPSISSSNFNDGSRTDEEVIKAEVIFQQPQFNPHLKYVNLRDHGYLLLTLNIREAIAEWYYVDKIHEPSSKEQLGMRYLINRGHYQLIQN